MNQTDKQALRQAVRARFPGMEARDRESELLRRRIAAWEPWRKARVVAGYIPLPREADVLPLLAQALEEGKTLLLPRVEGERRMTLRRVSRLDELVPGPWGLSEPPADARIVPVSAAELLLVPLEAVDGSGMRLGKGGGYYDALLEGAETLTLGVALSWQLVGQVPREPWDKPLAALADPSGVRRFSQPQA